MRKILFIILLIPFSYGAFSQAYKNIYAKGIYIYSNPTIDNNYILLQSPLLSPPGLTFTLPPSAGQNNFALTSLGNGSLTWTDPEAGGGGAAGSNGEVQFNDNGSFGASSNLFWDDTNNRLGVGTSSPEYNLDVSGSIKVGSANNQTGLTLYSEQGVTDYQVIFRAPSNLSSNITFSWPATDGSVNQILTTDGSGNLEWSTDATSSGNDCVGEGEDNGNQGTNTVTAGNGFVGGGTGNDISSGGTNGFIGGGENNEVSGSNSVVFVGEDNDVSGSNSMIVAGLNNTIGGNFSVIFAGEFNEISSDGNYSMIGAGRNNTIESSYSVIGAGENNTISTDSDYSIIGAGSDNFIQDSPYSGILSGQNNTVETSGSFSTIGGGDGNTISGAYSFIGAGNGNDISGDYSTIISGTNNTVSGDYSTVIGNRNNTASGDYSAVFGDGSTASQDYAVAFGRNVNANNEGSFVLGDGNTNTLSSSADNQMSARFENGYMFYSNSGTNNGRRLEDGQSSWGGVSDSTKKSKILKLTPSIYFDKLKNLKMYSWSYKGYENKKIRNYGPMAQDFHALFGTDSFGTIGNPLWLSPYNLSSVTTLALQGLNEIVEKNEKVIKELKDNNSSQKEKLERLKNILKELESRN